MQESNDQTLDGYIYYLQNKAGLDVGQLIFLDSHYPKQSAERRRDRHHYYHRCDQYVVCCQVFRVVHFTSYHAGDNKQDERNCYDGKISESVEKTEPLPCFLAHFSH